MTTPEIPLWARLAALIALLLAWPASAAQIAPAAPSYSGLLTPVALKCTRVFRQQGREVLLNTCGSCRIVKVSRRRPGSTAPVNRTFTIAPKTRTELSFRGPGQTRIQSDSPCKPGGNKASAPAPAAKKDDGKRCIKMTPTPAGLGLVNPCGECRMAVIERVYAGGDKRQKTVMVGGQSAMRMDSEGATGARVLSEKACK